MTRDQMKHLKDRIASVRRGALEFKYDEKPADVKAAERLLNKWREGQEKKRSDLRKKLSEAIKEAEEKVAFSAPEVALKEVQALERYAKTLK